MHQHDNIPRSKTLRKHVAEGLRESNKRRPFSFYLLLAMFIVVLLGVQFVNVRDEPMRFAFFLSLYFVFFFMVLFRAVVDFMEILRDHFRENEQVFRTTLGEDDFVRELGREVAANRDLGS